MEERIVVLRCSDIKFLEVFISGSGNPEEKHEIVGIRWLSNDGNEHGFGEINRKPDIVEVL